MDKLGEKSAQYLLKALENSKSTPLFNLINGLGTTGIEPESIIVISANFLIAIGLFVISFKKKGLE